MGLYVIPNGFPATRLSPTDGPDVNDVRAPYKVVDISELKESSAESIAWRLENSVDYTQTHTTQWRPGSSTIRLADAAELIATLPDEQLARLFAHSLVTSDGDTTHQRLFTNALFKEMGDKAVTRYTHIVEMMRWNPLNAREKQERLNDWIGLLDESARGQVLDAACGKPDPKLSEPLCFGRPVVIPDSVSPTRR